MGTLKQRMTRIAGLWLELELDFGIRSGSYLRFAGLFNKAKSLLKFNNKA